MKSMTGFGRGSFSEGDLQITIELKTVNNRFLDVNLRLPSELQALESTIKQAISARISRGRVDVNLQFAREGDVSFEINRPVISGYLAALKEIQAAFLIEGEPDLNMIAKLPNVLIPKRNEIPPENLAAVGCALELAIDDLEKMREKEGSMLQAELGIILGEIEKRLPAIEAESESIADEYRLRLTRKVGEMLAKTESQIEIDQARLAQEAAYLADRSDISEEVARLKAHIKHFTSLMNETAAIGKQLDFLTQELNREANTITSKSGNLIIKENALAIKSEIEKIREQVQNIE